MPAPHPKQHDTTHGDTRGPQAGCPQTPNSPPKPYFTNPSYNPGRLYFNIECFRFAFTSIRPITI